MKLKITATIDVKKGTEHRFSNSELQAFTFTLRKCLKQCTMEYGWIPEKDIKPIKIEVRQKL